MNRNKNEPMTRYWPGAITCRKAGEGQEESRQAVLSLSSEEPCKRWFGNEILCHDAGNRRGAVQPQHERANRQGAVGGAG